MFIYIVLMEWEKVSIINCFIPILQKDQHTFLRNGWNWLDFIVILMSYVTIMFEVSQFSVVKTVRVFRVLKTVNLVPGLKQMAEHIVYGIMNLRDVIILTLFVAFPSLHYGTRYFLFWHLSLVLDKSIHFKPIRLFLARIVLLCF